MRPEDFVGVAHVGVPLKHAGLCSIVIGTSTYHDSYRVAYCSHHPGILVECADHLGQAEGSGAPESPAGGRTGQMVPKSKEVGGVDAVTFYIRSAFGLRRCAC